MLPISIKACKNRQDSVALQTKKYRLQIPVRDFQSDNQQIYRDFLRITKAEQYPNITIGISLDDLHQLFSMPTSIAIPVDITMAGVQKTYQVRCTVTHCKELCLNVSGTRKMKLTDFNISPPEKLFGMIRVNNEINVIFGFVISVIHH
jgi:hypothetical protein